MTFQLGGEFPPTERRKKIKTGFKLLQKHKHRAGEVLTLAAGSGFTALKLSRLVTRKFLEKKPKT